MEVKRPCVVGLHSPVSDEEFHFAKLNSRFNYNVYGMDLQCCNIVRAWLNILF